MALRRAVALAGLALAALLAPGRAAGGSDGFLARRPLRVVPTSGEPDAQGGVEAFLRVTNGKRVLQGFSVWFRGLSDAEGASLWMAKPGETELEEVAAFAVSDNGSGLFLLRLDSAFENNPELPLAVERVLDLVRAPIEVRIASDSDDGLVVLRGSLGTFRWQDVDEAGGNPAIRGRRTAMRRPPEPTLPPDETASGTLRGWRRRGPGGATAAQGMAIFASGLTEEETYEVWVEDDLGDLQEVASLESTPEGLGFFSLDTRAGDDLEETLGNGDVRALFGRRVELRRSGFDDPSLVGLFPRVR